MAGMFTELSKTPETLAFWEKKKKKKRQNRISSKKRKALVQIPALTLVSFAMSQFLYL